LSFGTTFRPIFSMVRCSSTLARCRIAGSTRPRRTAGAPDSRSCRIAGQKRWTISALTKVTPSTRKKVTTA
jgi:hypothetical protein